MALVLCVQLLYCKAMFALIRCLSCGLILLLASIVAAPLAAQQLLEIEQDYPGIRVEQLITGWGFPGAWHFYPRISFCSRNATAACVCSISTMFPP